MVRRPVTYGALIDWSQERDIPKIARDSERCGFYRSSELIHATTPNFSECSIDFFENDPIYIRVTRCLMWSFLQLFV